MNDFTKKGLHLDLRVQVPPLASLRRIAREAAQLGMNTLIVEWEASFPFDRNAVISNRYAYTQGEVRQFLQDCQSLGLDVIPLQQCFGHVEYILRHRRYAELREDESDLSQVCPCRGLEARSVFTDIFKEMIALHESPYFHIGGDETYLLGRCPLCRKRSETAGESRLYVDYFRQLAEIIISLGKRPLLWIDMLLKYPEAAARMPSECVFIDWNYGWPVDRFGDFNQIAALPFEFWGAVSMRSAPDNHSSFSWLTHFDNLRDYIPVARSMNFQGIIMTSWSTSGVYGYEWEMPGEPLSILPLRRVGPHVGFRVLMQAFAEAANNHVALDYEKFLLKYAMERFGFNEEEAMRFREAILLSDRSEGYAELRIDAIAEVRKACLIMQDLIPERHGSEFERYKLMVELTDHHERLLSFEQEMQSEAYTLQSKELFAQRAWSLLSEGELLDDQFTKLYEDELYPEELREESEYRLKCVRNLVERTNGWRDGVQSSIASGSLRSAKENHQLLTR